MRFCLFCDAHDSDEAGAILSRLFIDAPLGFGDRDPSRAGRRTDRSYVVPPCVRLGGGAKIRRNGRKTIPGATNRRGEKGGGVASSRVR
jgi:hypothetical protein